MEKCNLPTKRALRIRYVIVDLITTAIAFFLFNIFRYYFLTYTYSNYTLEEYLLNHKIILENTLVPVCLLAVYVLSGFYNEPFRRSRLSEFVNTLGSAAFNGALIYLLILLNDVGMKRRDYLLIVTLIGILFICTYIGRYIVTCITLRKLRSCHWSYRAIVIGNSAISRETANQLMTQNINEPYTIEGYVNIEGEHQIRDNATVWSMDEVPEVCRQLEIDQIIIALESQNDLAVMDIVNSLLYLDIPIKIAPDTLSYITSNIRLGDIMGTPFVDLTSPRLSECQKNIKRLADIVISALVLIIFSPLYLFLAIAVKMSSSGPVIYSQERLGLKQRPFMIYKFRSMRCDAESAGPQLSHSDDPRITALGHVMRKYRLDELPQFWNVLKGDMSLVGPRPERKFFATKIIRQAPYYGLLFQVRPGITSWGMVKYGYASNVSQMVARSRYDLIYLNNMSLITDIKIIIYTVRTVFIGAGL